MKIEKENSVIVNLIGTGCKICIIEPHTNLLIKLNEAADKLKMPIEAAILDAEFFKYFDAEGRKDVASLSKHVVRGLLYDQNAQIEIRVGGRKKRKILLKEILFQQSLLPIYQFKIIASPEIIPDSLLVVEKEKGLVAGTKLFIDKLNLEKTDFEFMEVDTGIEKLVLLTRITNDGKKLNPTIKDTLVVNNYAVFTS